MDNQGYIDHPARDEASEESRKPHDQPRSSDDRHTPKNREIIELFPIRPTVELGFFAFPEKPFVMSDEIAPILEGRHHRFRAKQHFPQTPKFELTCFGIAELRPSFPASRKQGKDMQSKVDKRDDSAEAMECAGSLRSADELEEDFRPICVI